MAQTARQAVTVAPRYQKPALFAGSDAAWRSLCECYPTAETPEVVMAVVEYCAVRKLDPFKRPVHVVPMWNSRLRRKVQVVMQGINEVEITAARTQQWAGLDEPRFGPLIEKTFKGAFENDDGSSRSTQITLCFPEWCALTVYRLVGGERYAFSEQLWWLECYGRAGFRSEVPNERWSKAPRQMLHKCVKAAVLRAAFPEEAGYTAEEMEGRETESGGVTIEGNVDHGDAGPSDRDQVPPSGLADDATARLAALGYASGNAWLYALKTLLKDAVTPAEIDAIAEHPRVREAASAGPALFRKTVGDLIHEARERVMPPSSDQSPDWETPRAGAPDDAVAELVADIEAMDADAIDGLSVNAAWRAKLRALFPPDLELVQEALEARKAVLRSATAANG